MSKAYFINETGTWPEEVYKIALSGQLINPDLFLIPAENYFRFPNNYTVPITEYNRYEYLNALPKFEDGDLVEIDTRSNTLLIWNVSAERRAFDVGNTFNAFSIDVRPGIQTAENKFYSYLLYPKRLFLRPTGKPTFAGGNWTLNTQTVLLNTKSYFYLGSAVDVDPAYGNLSFIKSPPDTVSVPSSPDYSIVYNLCAVRTRIEVPVINFTQSENPNYFSTVLEPVPVNVTSKCQLRPNSTYVSYNVNFYAKEDDGTTSLRNLGQQRPDSVIGDLPTLKSSYVITRNMPAGKQAFQLVQIKNDTTNIELADPRYSVLSAVFDLSNTNFSYFNNNYLNVRATIVNLVTGVPDTSIGVSYIADCPIMQFTNERWQDTLISVGTPLGVQVATNLLPASINWVTKYPPHYYSYKASVKKSADPLLMETASLTFYLYSSAVSYGFTNVGYTTSITLSTYITSDFNFVSYDLQTGANRDYIKFVPLVPSNTIFLSSLSAYYGSSFQNYYSLIDSPWIPASAANNFKIDYPVVVHGELDFSLRPSLCSIAGYMDAYEATEISLATGQLPENKGQPIFLSKTMEMEDYMEADASFLISASSWPTRDLTDSYISWFFTPQNSFVNINAVDSEGNYLQNIPPASAVVFGPDTWSVVISGYGPTTTILNLSSQKYNEVTNLTSNSSLFNYFAEGRLLVGSPFGLNNLNEIRTVNLTAAVPYKGREYNLPSDTQISWVWSYNNDTDYESIPISAYYLPTLSSYPYGFDLDSSELSSVNFYIRPSFKNSIPDINYVNIKAAIDTQSGLVEGEYNCEVDDFPDPSIFNTDFYVFYTSFSNSISSYILNTREKKYVVTRPNNGTNAYTLCSLSDVIPTYVNATMVCEISSTSGFYNKYTGSPEIVPVSGIQLNISTPSITIVNLSAIDALVPGWTSAHNVQTNSVFNIINTTEFNTPLRFLTIPEFFWKDGRYLTLSDTSNYTLIPSNTAYANKKSNSQRYYLSSNKSFFNDYRYHTGTEKTFLKNISSYYELIDIPYQTSFFSNTGLSISLTAFDSTIYPESMGVFYKMPFLGRFSTFAFNITANTQQNNSIPLLNNPRIIPYSTITTSFTSSLTSVDLDTNRLISVTQKISTNPLESPVQPVGGTITYTLSTVFWSVNKEVPAIDGSYDLFELVVGDPVEILTVSGTRRTNLFLTASANTLKQIEPSTFNNYAENVYTGPRDLWNVIDQPSPIDGITTIVASSTAANPELFLSTTYTLTGSDIFIQYYTPQNNSNSFIVAYMTDFGEPNSYRITAEDSTLFYQYKNEGTYFISYSALYNDGSVKFYQHPNPIFVKSDWVQYDPNSIRFVEETELTLPYNDSEIYIQPNEWGDADIFNTSILRLQENLNYLASNLQTLDTSSPTVFFGWLGSNVLNYQDGIRWYTKDFGFDSYLNPSLAVLNGTSYFNNIKDAFETEDHVFILDGTDFICLSGDGFATPVNLIGSSDLKYTFSDPISIELDETGTIAFVADPPQNKVYRFDLEFNSSSTLNYTLNVGGLGSREDTNKFNSPSELAYALNNLYILDFNNNCVKQYNSDLNWMSTYYVDEFSDDIPVNIAIHPKFKLLYVLTKSKTIYIFEEFSENYFSSFKISEIESEIIKIIFDEVGEFLYVLTRDSVYKYSSSGYFITQLDLPQGINYVGAKHSKNRSIILISEKCIVKLQDVLDVYKVGDGLPSQYWSNDQLTVDRNEFSSDLNYNRSLIRIAQNIKMLRDTFNYKLVLATEQTPTSVITYFASVPVDISERPVFNSSVESEVLGVGINELHTPQTINRDLEKLYDSIFKLKSYLDISTFNVQDEISSTCNGQFCWSWKSMSCFKLKLPAIRICNINPITYAELEFNFPVSYAPSKTWAEAISECCNNTIPQV
jgi:hypothetical protein